MRLCTVIGCDRKYLASGLCSLHYQRVRNNGTIDESTKRVKGSGTITRLGYLRLSINGKFKFAHVAIAEDAINKPLPVGAQVHHWNGDRADNRPENLVICPDAAYHSLMHRRTRALDACGHAEWLKCTFCKVYDSPVNVKEDKDGKRYHLACRSAYSIEYQRHRKDRESIRRRAK